jgi:hypothetical protein
VNIRLAGRHITRDEILEAIDSYEIVEAYPDDKYLPSYLLLAAVNAAAVRPFQNRGNSRGRRFSCAFCWISKAM